MKKLTAPQIRALVAVHNSVIEVGWEKFIGIPYKLMLRLEDKGLVMTEGIRKPRWKLTPEGEQEVQNLIATGVLEKEQ